jgi:opacity protein-like surface antigen
MKNIITMSLSLLFIMLIGLNNIVLADNLPKSDVASFPILRNWAKSPYAHVLTKFVKSDVFLKNTEWLNQPYIRLDTGWSKLHDTEIPVAKGFPVILETKKVKSDFKPIIGGGIGFYLEKIRADITFNRHMAPVFKGSNNNTVKRQPTIDTYFLNIYWDLDIENNNTIFTPYMGVGIGVALVKDKVKNLVGTKALIQRKINFAHRCIIGTTITVTDNVLFDISYIYHHYGRSRSKTIEKQQYGRTLYRGHMLTTGIRVGF